MSELAFNLNGEAFEVPATATGWRVRRMKPKGAPEVVYGHEGLPLILPIEAELEDLKREVPVAGRYRLDPVAEGNKGIADASAAYVFVHETRPTAAPVAAASGAPVTDIVVIEAMRMNTELARSVIDRFPAMMEAAAVLLRAADGAGIPARAPMLFEAADDDDEAAPTEPPQAKAGIDLNAIVAQVVPMLVMGLAGGKLEMPKLAEIFDWRKAAAAATAASASEGSAKAAEAAEPASGAALPPLDPKAMAHFFAIQKALTIDEAALAKEIAKQLSPADMRTWFEELSALTVPEAVEKIRTIISGGKHTAAA